MTNTGNAAKYFMFFKWKSKFGVKNKATIPFTNHFDLGWKENSLSKIDWDPVELSRKTVMISTKPWRPPAVTCINFCWVCDAGLSEPLPHYSLFCGNCRPHISHSWANILFCDPNLVAFYLCNYLINLLNWSSKNELAHFVINWMKNTLLFTYSTNILIRLLTVNMNSSLTPKIRKCATPF